MHDKANSNDYGAKCFDVVLVLYAALSLNSEAVPITGTSVDLMLHPRICLLGYI